MRNLDNAVTDTLEELELEDIFDYNIREVQEDTLYHVTFQEKENGNNQIVIAVEYSTDTGDLLNDESWEGEIRVHIVQRHGIGQMTAEIIMELLAITLDEDYFDSEDEDDDDTIVSQPLTPPPSRVRLA